jgi:hypothetical protein
MISKPGAPTFVGPALLTVQSELRISGIWYIMANSSRNS